MVEAVKKLAKGAELMAYSLVLITKRNAELEATNKAATRRKSRKRKHIQAEGVLTAEEGQRLAALRESGARSDGKKAKKQVGAEVGEPSQRRCGRCQQAGHNVRTCKNAVEVDSG